MLTRVGKAIFNELSRTTWAFNLSKHGARHTHTMPQKGDQNIVWIDMEMSGLDVLKDHILEIACLITDKKLNIISREFHLIIHQSDEILNGMNEWCTQHHKSSGLTDAVRDSKVTVEDAEKQLLTFLKKYIPEKTCPLAGNSIYVDRLFLTKYMPTANEYLHYRIIDVSTIGELSKRWNKRVASSVPKKKRLHRAVDDIRESIEQLKHYKSTFFRTLE